MYNTTSFMLYRKCANFLGKVYISNMGVRNSFKAKKNQMICPLKIKNLTIAATRKWKGTLQIYN